jgi:hypothetical protein
MASYDVTAGSSTGAQTVKFKRMPVGDAAEGRDSKLKAYNRPRVIYSFTDTGIDSLFKLATGTVTVIEGSGGGSCPFVYTWNGSSYFLEDVILTETEHKPEGISVTDYLPFTFKPTLVDGKYRVRIHEQEAEKTFLDYIELLTIDHPIGYAASVEPNGNVIFGKQRVMPIEAIDDAGNDIAELLGASDGQQFRREGPGSLTLTFEAREGVHYAINAEGEPPPKNQHKAWTGPFDQQPLRLEAVRLEVEDALGVWHDVPRGPSRLPAERVRPLLDLSGYSLGNTFRIRYSWEKEFTLDEFALLAQENVDHQLRKVAPALVSHSGDHWSGPLVKRADGEFAELVTGEYLDLEFPAEPVPDGMVRSFVLMSNGYYLTWFGDQNAGRPLQFGLNGNYPNPFNPSTTIRYSLATDAEVKLEIFNILGQSVRKLVSGEGQIAGSYEILWDGLDEDGTPVGSGMYLYRLEANDFVETRKMIMLK